MIQSKNVFFVLGKAPKLLIHVAQCVNFLLLSAQHRAKYLFQFRTRPGEPETRGYGSPTRGSPSRLRRPSNGSDLTGFSSSKRRRYQSRRFSDLSEPSGLTASGLTTSGTVHRLKDAALR